MVGEVALMLLCLDGKKEKRKYAPLLLSSGPDSLCGRWGGMLKI